MMTIVYMSVRTISAGNFKAKCLAIMDEVKTRHETVIITKHGEPVAKLVPIGNESGDDLFGFCKDKGSSKGDIVSPLAPEDWGSLY